MILSTRALATLSVLAAAGGVLAIAPIDARGQDRPVADEAQWDGGSMVPCDVPLRWRVDEVDERFGITRQEAEDAVRLAGMLWEDAVGSVLFTKDTEGGFPVRFVYDERQEVSGERLRAQAELDESSRAIQEARAGLEARNEEIERKRSEYDRRLRDYRQRLERREEGDEEARAALERERRDLEALAEEVNRMVDLVNSETEELNRRIAQHNRASADLVNRFPPETVQSGTFRESRRTLGGRTVSVEREIRIYQFEDREHLILVLAHELGHALGLGHTGVPGSVMVDAAGPRSERGRSPRLTSSDLELLRARCPDL